MRRIAVFPGSFDPVTLGHIDIVERALPLFDKILIAIGSNTQKQGYFTLEQRMNWLQEIYLHEKKIEVHSYTGLTVDFCKNHHADFILRGLRSAADYEYEKVIAQTNRTMERTIETVFILSAPAYAHISSTIVKEVMRHHGKTEGLVPMVVTRDA